MYSIFIYSNSKNPKLIFLKVIIMNIKTISSSNIEIYLSKVVNNPLKDVRL